MEPALSTDGVAEAPPIPLSVAPMMDRTDGHYRAMMRGITRRTLLYTPMITTGALLRGEASRWLAYRTEEHPLALQLGGDDPASLAACAVLAEAEGYDEVNLNVGCPSSRVQGGNFGACLMKRPERVADCVAAMRAKVRIPVTVKHRIGVDDLDAYEDMLNFVDVVRVAGARRFSVHARKAWLSGLSPKENRTIPPLRHPEVYRLKRERPDLYIEINGGITTWDEIDAHLEHVDAVMLGRAAWDNPMLFAEADRRLGDSESSAPTREAVVQAFLPYAVTALEEGAGHVPVLRNLLNLFHGVAGARAFKRGVDAAIRGKLLGRALEAALFQALADAARTADELADRRSA